MTPPGHTLRSQHEAETHALFDFGHPAHKLDWTPSRAMVAQVFKAMWHASLPAEQINKIAIAFGSMQEGQDLTDTLTELTRAKVLRSITKRGVRRYEVNF